MCYCGRDGSSHNHANCGGSWKEFQGATEFVFIFLIERTALYKRSSYGVIIVEKTEEKSVGFLCVSGGRMTDVGPFFLWIVLTWLNSLAEKIWFGKTCLFHCARNTYTEASVTKKTSRTLLINWVGISSTYCNIWSSRVAQRSVSATLFVGIRKTPPFLNEGGVLQIGGVWPSSARLNVGRHLLSIGLDEKIEDFQEKLTSLLRV